MTDCSYAYNIFTFTRGIYWIFLIFLYKGDISLDWNIYLFEFHIQYDFGCNFAQSCMASSIIVTRRWSKSVQQTLVKNYLKPYICAQIISNRQ